MLRFAFGLLSGVILSSIASTYAQIKRERNRMLVLYSLKEEELLEERPTPKNQPSKDFPSSPRLH